jgi:hypothetical protein
VFKLASGDVFSDTEITVAAGAYMTIQPAAGVQVIITHTFANGTDFQFQTNSTGTTNYFGDAGGNSQFWNHMGSGVPLKLLLTNAETISAKNTGVGTIYAGYTGMEL